MEKHPLDNERFWGKVRKTDTCWFWTAYVKPTGYGEIRHPHGYSVGAHRVSYEIHFGDIRNGLFVCHTCDNRHCVNPEHLFLGTCAENMKDASNKGRMALGSRNGLSKLTEDEVLMIRSLYSEGYGYGKLAQAFGVSRTGIKKIVTRQTWTHL